MRIAVFLISLVFSGAAVAGEQSFLFDALHLKPYRASWVKLMKVVETPPDWLMRFRKNFDGASGEMRDLTIEGKPYQLSYVCDSKNCAAHKFEVLFDAGGEHAYGALGGKGSPPTYYGAPPQPLQDALAKALEK
jgi:hypothetical protein